MIVTGPCEISTFKVVQNLRYFLDVSGACMEALLAFFPWTAPVRVGYLSVVPFSVQVTLWSVKVVLVVCCWSVVLVEGKQKKPAATGVGTPNLERDSRRGKKN